MQDWLAIYAGQTHPRFAATSIELRLHRGESRGKQDRLLVQTYIGRDRPVSPVVILCVPSVIAILMEERFVVRSPIPFPRHFATPVEGTNYPTDSRIPFRGRFIVRVEVGFFQFVPIRIVLPLHDGIPACDHDRLAIDPNKSCAGLV